MDKCVHKSWDRIMFLHLLRLPFFLLCQQKAYINVSIKKKSRNTREDDKTLSRVNVEWQTEIRHGADKGIKHEFG